MNYPSETLCAVESCKHRNDVHKKMTGCSTCRRTITQAHADHVFVPLRLAGGALTPTEENTAYQRALRGEL